jgi:hypothetical protein
VVTTIQRLPQRVIESIRPSAGTESPGLTVQARSPPTSTAVAPYTSRTIQPSIKMRQIGSQPGVIGIASAAAPVSPGVGPRAAVNSPSSVVGKRQCSTVVNGVLQKCFDRSAGRSLRRPHSAITFNLMKSFGEMAACWRFLGALRAEQRDGKQ